LSAARGWSTRVRVEYLSWVCKTVSLLGLTLSSRIWSIRMGEDPWKPMSMQTEREIGLHLFPIDFGG
jgi:hypothetical protein